MLKAEQVPDEVFEAFQKAWAVTSTLSTKECLAAAINAWPEMVERFFPNDPTREPGIFLPLPKQEGEETDWGKPQGKEAW